MTETSARELILGTIGYIEISLPVAGKVSLHPYISCRAMDSYVAHSSDPRSAFSYMVVASLENASNDAFKQLADEDAEVIAQLYAEKEEFLSKYLEARKGKNVYDSFYSAFSSTEHWKESRRSQERLEAQLRQFSNLIPKSISTFSSQLERIVGDAAKLTFPAIKSPTVQVPTFRFPVFQLQSLPSWLSANSISIQLRSTAFLPNLVAVDSLSITAKANFDVWTKLTRSLDLSEQFRKSMTLHSTYLQSLTDRTLTAEKLLHSHANVFSAFNQIAETIRTQQLAQFDQWNLIGEAFSGSDALVHVASQHLLEEVNRPQPIVSTSHPEDEELENVYVASAEIEVSAKSSDSLVHGTAQQAILLGNDVARLLKELMSESIETALESKLAPYAPVLARMNLLSSPKSFLETLKDFAIEFQRDHWKVLWAEQGKKFNSKPESIARLALSMYLQGHCLGISFVGKELGNGDGFIDLLVNFMGTDYVVEVKIIGPQWSVGDAKAGLPQLDAYLENYSAASGFLIIFDGRVTDKGQQFEEEYVLPSGAKAKVIVVRSYFDRPSR